MTAPARRALERAPILARCGLMLAVAGAPAGSAGRGIRARPHPIRPPRRPPRRERRPAAPARAPAGRPPVAAPPTEQTTGYSVTARRERPISARSGRAGERVGDPERPPSPHSSSGEMLAVARAFAVAYMPYQVGRLAWLGARDDQAHVQAPGSRTTCFRPAGRADRRRRSAHPKDAETYRVVSVDLAAGNGPGVGDLRL